MFLSLIALAAADLPQQPLQAGPPLQVDIGHSDSEIWVKLAPGVSRLPGGALLAEPLFAGQHPELSRWWRVQTPDGAALGIAQAWLGSDWVSHVELAQLPITPPSDLPPTTPSLVAEQTYMGPAPDGFGVEEAALWPGGGGENVALADLEYDWLGSHEDLSHLGDVRTWGLPTERFAYHGTGVLGITSGGDNGYGVTGMVPDAEVVMIHPSTPEGVYNVGAAIEASIGLLEPGDVLLIEQQSYAFDNYAPVEVSGAVSDAIEVAVAAGIIVIEPAGNGAQDLDAAGWQGWFDRSQRDSGAIMVGGGMPAPGSSFNPARSWYPSGSCYGSRIDLQGWYGGIASTASGNLNDDLFNVPGDERQSYTATFGGTSGASPQVASLAAQFQSIAIAMGRAPWEPLALRQLMVQTGTPQTNPETALIGPQPDLRGMLRMAGLR